MNKQHENVQNVCKITFHLQRTMVVVAIMMDLFMTLIVAHE